MARMTHEHTTVDLARYDSSHLWTLATGSHFYFQGEGFDAGDPYGPKDMRAVAQFWRAVKRDFMQVWTAHAASGAVPWAQWVLDMKHDPKDYPCVPGYEGGALTAVRQWWNTLQREGRE